jgi:hypothetical protein
VEPAEITKWIELLGKAPTLASVIAWGVLELRRFLAALIAHMAAEEHLLVQIRDGLHYRARRARPAHPRAAPLPRRPLPPE